MCSRLQARVDGAAAQETGQGAVKIRLVQQERVVAFVGREFHERHVGAGPVQRAGDGAALARWGTASPR